MLTKLYICPGFHEPSLTRSFLNALICAWGNTWCDRFLLGVLSPEVPPYAPRQILAHLEECLEGVGDRGQGVGDRISVVWIGFSAGVVGALLAARQWYRQGHSVGAFIAVDGWGVPLWADFPVYSLSPDRLAYETTQGLRSRLPHFYADPPVNHLALWERPELALGWEDFPPAERSRLTAIQYIYKRLQEVW